MAAAVVDRGDVTAIDDSSHTSGSFTAATNSILVALIAGASGTSGVEPTFGVTDTFTGTGTWAAVPSSRIVDDIATPAVVDFAVEVWYVVVTSGGTGTITATKSDDTLDGFSVTFLELTGCDTSDPIGLVATAIASTGTSIGVNLGAAPASTSILVGVEQHYSDVSSPAGTQPTGWTETLDNVNAYDTGVITGYKVGTGAQTSTFSGLPSTGGQVRIATVVEFQEAPAATAPGAPTAVQPDDAFGYDSEVPLAWTAPASDGGSSITGYKIETSTNDGSSWSTHTADTGSATASATLTGLSNGTRYIFRVSAINAIGTGTATVSEWGCTPIADAAPATPPSSTNQTSAPWQLARIDQTAGPSGTTYSYRYTGAGVRIYVIDSGVRNTHDEFDNTTLVQGFSVADTTSFQDTAFAGVGHGTSVASCAVGATYGSAKSATLVSVKCFESDHNEAITWPTQANMLDCLDWIETNHPGGPAVITFSGALGDAGTHLNTIVAAVEAMVDLGFVFTIAAGNEGASPTYVPPNMEGVLIVAGCNTSDAIWSGSSRGSHTDIFAPAEGVSFATATSDTSTDTGDGTSEATPIVAGVLAMWLEANPDLTPRQLKDLALASSTKNVITGSLGGSPNRLIYSLADLPNATTDVDPVGAVSISATGTANVTATAEVAPTGAVSVTATGTANVGAQTDVSATGAVSLTATSTASVSATAEVAPTGAVSASATGTAGIDAQADITPTGAVSLTFTGTGNIGGTTAINPTGAVSTTAPGTADVEGQADIAPTGAVSTTVTGVANVGAAGSIEPTGAVSLTVSGTANVTATPEIAPTGASSTSVTGTAQITATAQIAPTGAVSTTVTGTATITATAGITPVGAVSLTFTGTADVGEGVIVPIVLSIAARRERTTIRARREPTVTARRERTTARTRREIP